MRKIVVFFWVASIFFASNSFCMVEKKENKKLKSAVNYRVFKPGKKPKPGDSFRVDKDGILQFIKPTEKYDPGCCGCLVELINFLRMPYGDHGESFSMGRYNSAN